MRSVGGINECDFCYCLMQYGNILKICIIPFLNDCAQNYAWLKDLLKVQDRPNDFKVTEYKKFTDMVSGSTWQLTVKELPQNQLM